MAEPVRMSTEERAKMKRLWPLLAAALLVCLWHMPRVSAHVLLSDKDTGVSAIFHINPDDDPIAGQPSQLYFDLQNSKSSLQVPPADYRVIVTEENGTLHELTTTASGTTLSANYVFPRQGLYRISVDSGSNGSSDRKVHIIGSLRVTRGTGTTLRKNSEPIAMSGLVGSLVGLLLLGIYGFNNRKRIIAKSKF